MPPLLRAYLRLLLDDTPVAVRPDWLRRASITVGFPAFALGALAALFLLARFPRPGEFFRPSDFSVREIHPCRERRALARRRAIRPDRAASGGRR